MPIFCNSEKFYVREFLPVEETLFCSFFDDKELTRFLPDLSMKQYKIIFNTALQDYQTGPYGRWGIFEKQTNLLIGTCLFRTFTEDTAKMEIGYSLIPSHWGKGIATEIALALVTYGFAVTDCNEIMALVEVNNIGSKKVLTKAGFEQIENIKRPGIELDCFRIKRN